MSTEVQAESSATAVERAHKVKKVKKAKKSTTATTHAEEAAYGAVEEATKKPSKEQVDDGTLLEVDVDLPAPLSKAEARAARKRAKKAEEAGLPEPASSEAAGKGKGKEKEKVEQVKRQNSVWIGNLSYRTTTERVKEFFVKGVAQLGGDEDSVTRIHMPTKPGHGGFADNKGFAYVDFTSPENQALAVQLSEKLIEGRKVLIKRGDDYKADPNARTPKPAHIPGLGKQTRPESSTLFVGNLPFDATEEALRDFVEENAEAPEPRDDDSDDQKVRQDGGRGGKKSGLRKVRLGAFEDTGRCKGFAFLDFYSPAQATKILANRKIRFFSGRRLQLEYASEEATKRSGGGSREKRPRTQGVEQREDGDDVRPKRSRNNGAVKAKESGAQESAEGLGELEIARIAVAQSFDGTSNTHAADRDARPKGDKRGKKWEATGRPRPGAALAMAKREKVSIVTGGQQGNKITFD